MHGGRIYNMDRMKHCRDMAICNYFQKVHQPPSWIWYNRT